MLHGGWRQVGRHVTSCLWPPRGPSAAPSLRTPSCFSLPCGTDACIPLKALKCPHIFAEPECDCVDSVTGMAAPISEAEAAVLPQTRLC